MICLAAAQTPPVVFTPGNGIKPPVVLEKNAAEYTEEARRARLEGAAVVSLVVDEDGSTRDVHVTRPLGLGLDESAIETIKSWKFAPGTKDGQPVPVLIKVEANFRMLTARTDWHTARCDFVVPAGASRPVMVQAEFPPASDRSRNADVVISFDVDEQGRPVNLRVESASDASAENEGVQALRAWRFQPALKNGKPVAVRGTIEFVHGNRENPTQSAQRTPAGS
jgi:TonB family protein